MTHILERIKGRRPSVPRRVKCQYVMNMSITCMLKNAIRGNGKFPPLPLSNPLPWSNAAWTFLKKSRKENPQKLTQLSSRSHPRHLVGKRTAQKDTIIDITSDSQVNNNFPYRWTPASLTFNNYFYLFLYLYITWITINNNAPHLKSPKNQNRRAALGRPGALQNLVRFKTHILNILSFF